MTTRRQRQVAELIHEEISLLIQRRVRDPRLGFVTVTGVEVSPDLRVAHVYVSVLGSDDDVKRSLVGEEATVKRFFREDDHVRLQPENDSMEPIRTTEASVLGKVVGVFRKI